MTGITFHVDHVVRFENPRTYVVHNADFGRHVTHCGVAVGSIFAAHPVSGSRFLTLRHTDRETTCHNCLRGGIEGCHR